MSSSTSQMFLNLAVIMPLQIHNSQQIYKYAHKLYTYVYMIYVYTMIHVHIHNMPWASLKWDKASLVSFGFYFPLQIIVVINIYTTLYTEMSKSKMQMHKIVHNKCADHTAKHISSHWNIISPFFAQFFLVQTFQANTLPIHELYKYLYIYTFVNGYRHTYKFVYIYVYACEKI